jgi:hypothetical protein
MKSTLEIIKDSFQIFYFLTYLSAIVSDRYPSSCIRVASDVPSLPGTDWKIPKMLQSVTKLTLRKIPHLFKNYMLLFRDG